MVEVRHIEIEFFPNLPKQLLFGTPMQGAVPDVIKRAESFCTFMDKVVVHMRERLTKQVMCHFVLLLLHIVQTMS